MNARSYCEPCIDENDDLDNYAAHGDSRYGPKQEKTKFDTSIMKMIDVLLKEQAKDSLVQCVNNNIGHDSDDSFEEDCIISLKTLLPLSIKDFFGYSVEQYIRVFLGPVFAKWLKERAQASSRPINTLPLPEDNEQQRRLVNSYIISSQGHVSNEIKISGSPVDLTLAERDARPSIAMISLALLHLVLKGVFFIIISPTVMVRYYIRTTDVEVIDNVTLRRGPVEGATLATHRRIITNMRARLNNAIQWVRQTENIDERVSVFPSLFQLIQRFCVSSPNCFAQSTPFDANPEKDDFIDCNDLITGEFPHCNDPTTHHIQFSLNNILMSAFSKRWPQKGEEQISNARDQVLTIALNDMIRFQGFIKRTTIVSDKKSQIVLSSTSEEVALVLVLHAFWVWLMKAFYPDGPGPREYNVCSDKEIIIQYRLIYLIMAMSALSHEHCAGNTAPNGFSNYENFPKLLGRCNISAVIAWLGSMPLTSFTTVNCLVATSSSYKWFLEKLQVTEASEDGSTNTAEPPKESEKSSKARILQVLDAMSSKGIFGGPDPETQVACPCNHCYLIRTPTERIASKTSRLVLPPKATSKEATSRIFSRKKPK